MGEAVTMPSVDNHASWRPTANPWLIASAVMTATFMVVLDSSVANVALPHIAGDLSASNDEATWVLTSYLVSNAIMLPATSWITRRMGRKNLLMVSIVIFTVASMLCGLAVSMPMLVVARILQGIGGGGMQPLAQAILLESFPPQQHSQAMAVYGMGIVVAPVIGPTLGGWITDSYTWRWLFYINLPVGLLALFMASVYIEDPPYLKKVVSGKIDALGFGFMALWLGAMQLVLDKGQELDWFSSNAICYGAVASVIAFVLFIVRELRCKEPIVQLHVLKNRNFAVGTLVAGLYGFSMYSAIALLPLFLQTLIGYTAYDSGLAVSPRGIGSMISMFLAGVIASRVDGRYMLMFGFAVFGISALMLGHVNLGISMSSVALPNMLNGFAGGFVFVPLTTLAMGKLHKHEIGNAAGLYNLVRNIGGSVGIACATALIVRRSQIHQMYLGGNLTGSDSVVMSTLHGLSAKFYALGADLHSSQDMALLAVNNLLHQQAALLAYADVFNLIGWVTLACVPLVLLFQKVAKR